MTIKLFRNISIYCLALLCSYTALSMTWIQRNLNTSGLTVDSYAYGNGIYVAVGDNGNVWTSTNALRWTAINAGGAVSFRRVRYLNGIFIATTSRASVLTSTDGFLWTRRYLNTNTVNGASLTLWDIAGNQDGTLVAVGGVAWWNGPATSLIVRSTNGITWEEMTVPQENDQVFSVAYGQGKFVALKSNGTSYISSNGLNRASSPTGPGPASPYIWVLLELPGGFSLDGLRGAQRRQSF